METRRTDRAPLARDEVAQRIFAPLGPGPLSWRAAVHVLWPFVSRWPSFLPRPRFVRRAAAMVDLLAVRTRFLDDHVLEAPPQRVAVGAGLDARSLRLAGGRTYELDFEGLFAAKKQLFAAAGSPLADVTTVATDLTDGPERWSSDLVAAGFDAEEPSTWVLEGLTPYLDAAELDALLAEISRLAAPGSVLVATWLRPARDDEWRLKMHRGFVEDPTKLLAPFGWGAIEQAALEAAAAGYGVEMDESPVGGYWLTAHEKM
mmetsp:Transcript_15456/g.46158  ORF Transcript_15456/g.46158 Transcript_15456/m.46158 type:complete len:260 (-) Transcript_15456:25-804(-)